MYQKLRGLTADMVSPISVQGLHGRMLIHPSRRSTGDRTLVFVYGIHGSLERFYGVIHFLARFGRVVVPDLPGLGGMDSFYKIGKEPSLDAYGDYLSNFIAQEVPEGQLTLIGLSYGFVALTRMLVRHPDLSSRVKLIISAMGLADGRDIKMSRSMRTAASIMFWFASTRPLDRISQYVITRPWLLRLSYGGNNPKFKAIPPSDRPKFIAFESYLWRCNDMRTYGTDMRELFRLRQPGAHVPLTVHHITTASDHWLDVAASEKHIRDIYMGVEVHESAMSNHGGTVYTGEDEAQEMIPVAVTQLLEATA